MIRCAIVNNIIITMQNMKCPMKDAGYVLLWCPVHWLNMCVLLCRISSILIWMISLSKVCRTLPRLCCLLGPFYNQSYVGRRAHELSAVIVGIKDGQFPSFSTTTRWNITFGHICVWINRYFYTDIFYMNIFILYYRITECRWNNYWFWKSLHIW